MRILTVMATVTIVHADSGKARVLTDPSDAVLASWAARGWSSDSPADEPKPAKKTSSSRKKKT